MNSNENNEKVQKQELRFVFLRFSPKRNKNE